MVSFAFAVCTFLAWRNAPKREVKREKIVDFAIIVLIAGIIGARTVHVLTNIEYYLQNPLDIFMLSKGGLVYYGGLISGFISGIIYLKINSIKIWPAMDLFAPYIALGQALGRIGCFLNGCCFGKICPASFFAVRFPGEAYYRYATQIYAVLILVFIYIILRVAGARLP